MHRKNKLKMFTTDGCTLFPDYKSWVKCCIEHDFAYWKGGTREERIAADIKFEQCMNWCLNAPMAKLARKAVRVGGSPYWPTPWRWGYGWPYGRGYKPLDKNDMALVSDKLKQMKRVNKILSKAEKNETPKTS